MPLSATVQPVVMQTSVLKKQEKLMSRTRMMVVGRDAEKPEVNQKSIECSLDSKALPTMLSNLNRIAKLMHNN